MTIEYRCPVCRATTSLPDSAQGQLASCSRCKLKFVAPAPIRAPDPFQGTVPGFETTFTANSEPSRRRSFMDSLGGTDSDERDAFGAESDLELGDESGEESGEESGDESGDESGLDSDLDSDHSSHSDSDSDGEFDSGVNESPFQVSKATHNPSPPAQRGAPAYYTPDGRGSSRRETESTKVLKEEDSADVLRMSAGRVGASLFGTGVPSIAEGPAADMMDSTIGLIPPVAQLMNPGLNPGLNPGSNPEPNNPFTAPPPEPKAWGKGVERPTATLSTSPAKANDNPFGVPPPERKVHSPDAERATRRVVRDPVGLSLGQPVPEAQPRRAQRSPAPNPFQSPPPEPAPQPEAAAFDTSRHIQRPSSGRREASATPAAVTRSEPTQTVVYQLLVVEGLDSMERYSFHPGGSYVIGRDPTTSIPIVTRSISRRHALLETTGPDPVLIDLGSANGIRVNGTKVSRMVLRDGDIVKLGEVVMRFEAIRTRA